MGCPALDVMSACSGGQIWLTAAMDSRLQALKEKIAEQKKHLDALDANVYVDVLLTFIGVVLI